MTVVTRFPPSPTGFMHIGTARTALFNWLYARGHGGKMLFRIEDTDRARHSEEAVTALINSMTWLGLDWDGEIVSQYGRHERHSAVAYELLEKGLAYRCYCSAEELETMREQAKAEGRPVVYDRRWRDRDPSEAPEGVDPVIRIKAPLEGKFTVNDHVQGAITIDHSQLDDFILLRSDGSPTYMLAVVVDDHDMAVTHVIRGDDHLNNTFRQNVIYDAMGWDKPDYAHVPLILGPDGSKMSKRHGAASVEEYREMGYLPEAMRNYLLRLGWSHGDDEIISTQQAIEWFNLDSIGKSPARFDFDKLESINAHYMKSGAPEDIFNAALSFYEKRHGFSPDEASKIRILSHADELQERAKTLLQYVDESVFYIRAPESYDEKSTEVLQAENADVIQALIEKLEALEDYKAETIQAACKEIAKDLREGKMGKVGMPLRAALTGTTASPSIFKAAAILGKEDTVVRLKAAISHAPS